MKQDGEPPLITIIVYLIIIALIIVSWVFIRPSVLTRSGKVNIETREESVVGQVVAHDNPRTEILASIKTEVLKDNSYPRDMRDTIKKLIKCESSGNIYAHNEDDPNGGSFGILQYQIPTFQHFCVKKYGLNNDIWNPDIQIECCAKMLSEGLINHWTCGRTLDK